MSYNITDKNYSIGINSTYALLYIAVKKIISILKTIHKYSSLILI